MFLIDISSLTIYQNFEMFSCPSNFLFLFQECSVVNTLGTCHHRGVSGYAGTLSFPAVEAHTEHRVLVRRDGGPIVPPPPDPGDLAGKYEVQAPAKDFEATLLGLNPTPGDSTLGTLSQDRSPRSESYARWWNIGS